ncbi:protein C2-DOMAIN ABA-RELATED 4-like [Fagus crenata]
MESLLGLLRIHVQKGVNLAIRDVRSSDPYVIVKMGKQEVGGADSRLGGVEPEAAVSMSAHLDLEVEEVAHIVFLRSKYHNQMLYHCPISLPVVLAEVGISNLLPVAFPEAMVNFSVS